MILSEKRQTSSYQTGDNPSGDPIRQIANFRRSHFHTRYKSEMSRSDKLLLFLRLVLSLLCAIINGIDLSFNVYAVILKSTFNFTQTQGIYTYK